MRISGSSGKMLAFDNMRNRPITGTNDWTHHTIVLDVGEDAEDIIFGILLSLKGQVWMADVHIGVVDKDVPTTNLLTEITPYFPVNLGFDE
jgi:AraC family transcriptional regulator